MLDPDFDPLMTLERLQHQQQELIKAINHTTAYLTELSLQHQSLTELLANIERRLAKVENWVNVPR